MQDGYNYTIDVERFTGLNVCNFNPIGVFAEVLSLPWPFAIHAYVHGEAITVILKTVKNMKV